jgi:hypothetical protein
MTAFGTTACQNFSAIGSLHAFAETMNSFTAAAMRLKCTFHFKLFFHVYQITRGEPGLFQFLPTGHHTRRFCERTAKVRVESLEFGIWGLEILERGVKMGDKFIQFSLMIEISILFELRIAPSRLRSLKKKHLWEINFLIFLVVLDYL